MKGAGMIHWIFVPISLLVGFVSFPVLLVLITRHYEKTTPDCIDDDPPIGI